MRIVTGTVQFLDDVESYRLHPGLSLSSLAGCAITYAHDCWFCSWLCSITRLSLLPRSQYELNPLQITAIICFGCGIIFSLVTLSARLLTSAFIFITFSTGIETLNNYGFDVERSELWSGIAALCALFLTMGINKIVPAIFAAIFAAYGFIRAGLRVTGNQVSTFEPVEVKTFILMLPIVILSVMMQNHDKVKQEEKELAKYEPDAKTKEAQQHFLKL